MEVENITPTTVSTMLDQVTVRKLVEQAMRKQYGGQQRISSQLPEKIQQQQNNYNPQLLRTQKYTFDMFPKTIYFMDHNLMSLDTVILQKCLAQLNEFFAFMFQNPHHMIKENQIINLKAQQNDLHKRFNLQSMNPLIARLLDLFLNCKTFSHKKYVADILIRYSPVIKQTIIKDEIVLVLNKGLKGYDEYTRVMSARIVPAFTEMFEKDLAGFQYIVQRVQALDTSSTLTVASIVERQAFRECLREMLEQSSTLSSFFTKNLQQQSLETQFIPQKKCLDLNNMSIVNYCQLCLSLKLNTTQSLNLFKSLLTVYKRRSLLIHQKCKGTFDRLKQLIGKIFEKLFDKNFKILETFYLFGMQSQIQLNLEIIQQKYHQFDEHQQNYILRSCPQKLKQLLTESNKPYKPQFQSLKQQQFYKMYSKLNQFEDKGQLNDIRKNLNIKQRRMQQFKQLCELQNHNSIASLVDIWIKINNLLALFLDNSGHQQTQSIISSITLKLQQISRQNSLGNNFLCQQIQLAAEIFLFLQKCAQQDMKLFFCQNFWNSNPKIQQQNKNYLKWTYFNSKTISQLKF